VSEHRHQALIAAPIERVWELVGNPSRHPDWWPRVVEVRGDRFEVGDVMRVVSFHCRDTGTYTHWLLAPARADTFVEANATSRARPTSGRRVSP
jgi:hypothetical protein